MSKLVVSGATLECDQGVTPGSLTVLPASQCDVDGQPIATVNDHLPTVNIAPFGACKTQANPAVAAATAAAMGVLTHQPCVPVTSSRWSPGSSLGDLQGDALLTADCTCKCQWSGEISVVDPATDVEIES